MRDDVGKTAHHHGASVSSFPQKDDSSARFDSPAAFRAWLLEKPARAVAWIDEILTPAQVVAEFPAIAGAVGTLANMRYANRGPRYIKGAGGIYYRRLDCIAYLERITVTPGE